MATYSHIVTRTIVTGGTQLSQTQTEYTGTGQTRVTEAITTGQTDKLVNFTLDVSACKSFFIKSDQAVTIETNSAGSPANTLTLAANVPYYWDPSSLDTFKLTTDVTALYVTNASGETANLLVDAIYDSTP